MMSEESANSKPFRSIGEVAEELGVGQHILRYWETKFPQLKPVQRAGNRRYYRPEDVALVRQIHHLLHGEGYSIAGVKQALSRKNSESGTAKRTIPYPLSGLQKLRERLAAALLTDAA